MGGGNDLSLKRGDSQKNSQIKYIGAAPVRSRAGFTLIELIVTLLISVIVVAVTITFITSGTRFLARTETSASDKSLSEGAADFVKERLLYAKEVKVVPVTSDPASLPAADTLNGYEVIYIGNEDGTEIASTGRLYYKRADDTDYVNILGDELYKGRELALDYSAVVEKEMSPDNPGEVTKKTAAFDVRAKVVKDGAQTKEASQIFRMYNIGIGSEPLDDISVTSWDGDDPTKNTAYYLLITPSGGGESDDYARGGLIMYLDAHYNAIKSNGDPYHDQNAMVWKDLSGNDNDVQLTFTDNPNAIEENWISFDGNGDFGKSVNRLMLSGYDHITVEVCFQIDANYKAVFMLYETTSNWNINDGAFGVALNTQSSVYDPGYVHTARFGERRNYYDLGLTYNSGKFTTHTMTFSRVQDLTGWQVFIDGSKASLSGPEETGNIAQTFANDYFFLASRNGDGSFNGKIASVRIYGRKLTDDEIASNAFTDQLRYN